MRFVLGPALASPVDGRRTTNPLGGVRLFTGLPCVRATKRVTSSESFGWNRMERTPHIQRHRVRYPSASTTSGGDLLVAIVLSTVVSCLQHGSQHGYERTARCVQAGLQLSIPRRHSDPSTGQPTRLPVRCHQLHAVCSHHPAVDLDTRMDLSHQEAPGVVIQLFPLVMLQCPRCFDVGPPRWVGENPRPMSANAGLMVRTCGYKFYCAGCSGSGGCLRTIAYCYGCGNDHGWRPVRDMLLYEFPKNIVLAFSS